VDEHDKDGRGRRCRERLVGVVLLLAAVVGVVFIVKSREARPLPLPAAEQQPVRTAVSPDTAQPAVVTAARDTAPPRAAAAPGRGREGRGAVPADTASGPGADTTPGEPAGAPDTAGVDTAAGVSVSAGCAGDTLALWVWPEPSGGLHRGSLGVVFRANKPCDIFWRCGPDTAWLPWSGAPVAVDSTATIAFRALDRCGRAMEERREYYEIDERWPAARCPPDMELVQIGAASFCIDRYEWPNRKGALPLSYVSLSQAADSCFTAGKRLCTSEEWSLACAGPYSYGYPYGQKYEPYACVTHDTTARPSGSRPECRGFFGMFDMSGNLLEWTSTPSSRNRQFNNVMGGFWQSGPRSGCFDVRYSYFPQNRHNPVGFRCCKASTPAEK
jgi:hypothetical protein